jgi:hypothetical protein
MIAVNPVDLAAVQAAPRGPYRRRSGNGPPPASTAAIPQAPIITEAAAIRRLVRRYILQGSLPSTSPHSGMTVAEYNAKTRAELAAPKTAYSWSSTGRAA